MRWGWLAILAALAALPASGDPVQVNQRMLDALSTIDHVPSKAAVAEAFRSAEALSEVALDRSQDLSVQLRAIGALPALCGQPCGAGTVAHDTLYAIVTGPSLLPEDALRLRAAVAALAQTGSHTRDDIAAMIGLLDHDSRDIRATAVRALHKLSDCSTKQALLRRLVSEKVKQVQYALNAALSAFEQCR